MVEIQSCQNCLFERELNITELTLYFSSKKTRQIKSMYLLENQYVSKLTKLACRLVSGVGSIFAQYTRPQHYRHLLLVISVEKYAACKKEKKNEIEFCRFIKSAESDF